MKFTDIFIRRPVLATVVSLMILVLGIRSENALPILQYPRTQNAVVTVTTTYYGADPDVIAGFISTPLENAIAQANGIDYMTSASRVSTSTITVNLRLNYDANRALTEIQTKISSVINQLPAGVQLVLCASAPDTPEIEQRLRRIVAEHPNVKWIFDMVSHEVVTQLYSHAAVFACPSVYEPFGIINLEAMACETPVVASAVGGILEVVEDGRTGLLVPPASPDALAAAIRRVLDDRDFARALGQAGRRRVEDRFSWTSVAERTERVYADAIAGFSAV